MTSMTADLDSLIQQEFCLAPDLIYLNHAAVAPWPARTRAAVEAFARENATWGARHYPRWQEKEENLRHQFASLINAPSAEDIALLKNTSEALSQVAYGLTWEPGDNVVISNQEFPSNRIVWHSLASLGAEVREVDLSTAQSPEQALLSACDARTRLLSISAVQYATGLCMDLEVLGDYCRQQSILFCVDAIQSIGALPFDVQAIQADFVMADTHKWMLGPEAVALFYCRPSLRESLTLHEFGWHMLEDSTNYTASDWVISPTARRFECGSPNMLGIHAASASLELIAEIGMAHIAERVLSNTQLAVQRIADSAVLELISDPTPARASGIITFRSQKIHSDALYRTLMQQNVVCAARGGGVRFSPHFYTSPKLILQALELAESLD